MKSLILLFGDLFLVGLAWYVALALRLSDAFPLYWATKSLPLLVFLLLAGGAFTLLLGIHLTKLRQYESSAEANTAIWVGLLAASGTAANTFFDLGAPRTVPIIVGPVLFMLVIGFRFGAVALMRWLGERGMIRVPIAVYGAGAAGQQMVAALKNSREFRPVLFVDDNVHMQGLIVSGIKVYPPGSLENFLESGKVAKVFLAMPSSSRSKRKTILRRLESLDCEVRELPSYVDLINSGDVLTSLRPVSPEELLGRDGVDLRIPEIERTYRDANVFVSGAGGSIGSELCRRILELGARKLVLFELSELALYTIDQELRPVADLAEIELISALGSVNDAQRLRDLFQEHSIDIVLHAAAYKHVPLIEENELEAARNNVLGTKTIAETATTCGVGRFTLVSTDKAVRPTSVMGASKRFAELVVQGLSQENARTLYSIVRFGNVLGSSGSVIPHFKSQIEHGGPITLTHEEVTRYFMTIPEAARLVLLAGSYAEGGDVFVLDMGDPVRIRDLAAQMIKLSGLTERTDEHPDGDIEIEVTGLRPGEKLYEELLIDADSLPTPHPKIMRAREKSLSKPELEDALSVLHRAIENGDRMLFRTVLKVCVDGYNSPPKFIHDSPSIAEPVLSS